MAEKLYRLGRWSASNKWKVVIGWVVVLLVFVAMGLGLKGKTSDSFSIPGTESQNAIDLLNKEFPAGNSGTVQVIFKAPEGKTLTDEAVKASIGAYLEASMKDTNVLAVMDPYTMRTISPDLRIGYANVVYKLPAGDVPAESKDLVLANAELTRKVGIQTEFGGTVQLGDVAGGHTSEAIGILVAYIVLGITFLSMVTAGLPILTALVGVLSGAMLVQAASGFLTVTSATSALALMLGLAVGIDYALLIISRARQEAARGADIVEAIALSTGTAGSAVVFAGLTVMIALLGLAVVNVPFLTMMGAAAAVTVLVAICVAITLVPALLAMTGRRFVPKPRKAKAAANQQSESNVFGAWARMVSRYPVLVILVCLALIGTISYPSLHMKTGLPDNGTKAPESTERKGYDLLTEGFGPGFNGPIMLVVHAADAAKTKEAAEATANRFKTEPNVVAIAPPNFNQTGDLAILTLIPKDGPTNDRTTDLVNLLRQEKAPLESQYQAQILLTGTAVMNIDVTEKLNEALPIFLATIVGLGLIILGIVFRSIWVPVKATLGFLFTIFSALGAVVFVFQDGNLNEFLNVPSAGPILNFLPVLLVGILFGLAMDYQVFLVTRMREDYAHSGDARRSVITGMEHNGLVVTVAAVIMIAVFSGFIFTSDPIIKSLGLALAVGVLIDAFVVRMTLVPAVMALMGRSIWYMPKWLDRILPNVDIEGEGLMVAKEAAAAKKATASKRA